MRTRRNFSAEFKETAVRALESSTVAEVARASDVSISVLHRWRRKLAQRAVNRIETRRRFPKDVKASLVARLEQGASIAEVAAALDVGQNTLHRWRKEVRDFGAQAFSGYGKNRESQERGRAIKITLDDRDYRRVVAAFESSSARSLPDFARAALLEDEDDSASAAAIQEIDDALENLAGILKRILWISAAAPRAQRARASHS